MRTSSRLRRFGGLHKLQAPGDALLLLRIYLFAASVPLLSRMPLPTLLPRLDTRLATDASHRPERAQKVVSYTEAVLRRAPLARRDCLPRGLTLFYFLRRAGVDVALCFGTGSPEGDFAGHCWLVRDGEPYLEKASDFTFEEIYRFPARGQSSLGAK